MKPKQNWHAFELKEEILATSCRTWRLLKVRSHSGSHPIGTRNLVQYLPGQRLTAVGSSVSCAHVTSNGEVYYRFAKDSLNCHAQLAFIRCTLAKDSFALHEVIEVGVGLTWGIPMVVRSKLYNYHLAR